MPKVSIVMPVYNKAEYLHRTFKNLLNQQYKDWELVVIDDGSTDDSSRIIKIYAEKDSRIHAFRQNNKGVSAARNIGQNIAVGEWIWFIDADDLPNVNFLEQVFKKEYDEKVDIIVGNFEKLEDNGTIQNIEIDEQGMILAKDFAEIFMKYQYKMGFWGYIWNKLVRREFIIQKDIKFQEGLTLAEDLKYMVALYKENANIFCLSQSATRYTVDAINASSEKKIDYLAQLYIQLEIKEWIICKCKRTKYIDFFNWNISRYAAFVVYYGFEDKDDYIYLARLLVNNPQVESQLCVNNLESVMYIIVWCLIHRKYYLLKLYLEIRKKIRCVYRKIHN